MHNRHCVTRHICLQLYA